MQFLYFPVLNMSVWNCPRCLEWVKGQTQDKATSISEMPTLTASNYWTEARSFLLLEFFLGEEEKASYI